MPYSLYISDYLIIISESLPYVRTVYVGSIINFFL